MNRDTTPLRRGTAPWLAITAVMTAMNIREDG
jgi:hypothetical protein